MIVGFDLFLLLHSVADFLNAEVRKKTLVFITCTLYIYIYIYIYQD